MDDEKHDSDDTLLLWAWLLLAICYVAVVQYFDPDGMLEFAFFAGYILLGWCTFTVISHTIKKRSMRKD